MRRLTILLALTAFAAVPASAEAAGLRAGAGKADITPRTGYYLGGWTRADRVARASTRACSRGRSCSSATGARSRSSRSTCSWSRAGWSSRSATALADARLLRAEHPHLGVAHALGPGRLRELPDAQHRRAEPADGHRPALASRASSTPSPPTRSSTASSLEQIASAIRAPTTTSAPAAAGWGSARILGLTRNRSHRGPPRQPRHRQGARRGPRGRRPGRLRAHDRPGRRRAARRQARRGAGGKRRRARADRRLVELRRPRHGHQVVVPVLQRRPPRARRCGCSRSGVRSAARCRAARRSSTSTATPTRATCRPASTATGRRRRTTSAASRRRRCCARGSAAGRAAVAHARRSTCAGRAICFCGQEIEDGRVADQSRGRPAVPHRLRGGARPALRHHRRALRGHARAGRPRRPARLQGRRPLGAGDVPQRRAAARGADRAAADRLGAGRGDEGGRRADPRGGRRGIAGSGIERVVISGLANEFVLYFTTPEEYDRQHYEGGNTHFGRLSSVLHQPGAGEAGRHARARRAGARRRPTSTRPTA